MKKLKNTRNSRTVHQTDLSSQAGCSRGLGDWRPIVMIRVIESEEEEKVGMVLVFLIWWFGELVR